MHTTVDCAHFDGRETLFLVAQYGHGTCSAFRGLALLPSPLYTTTITTIDSKEAQEEEEEEEEREGI